ncbi:MAG: ZIP family metal transporter [Candidatus Niyogibacteria bacterium]|nr:ZIP family metal transporter [Candidatus Niyogibacteria bacterium]
MTLLWILGASFGTSIVSLAGRSIAFLGEARFRQMIHYTMSLAVGVLLGVVFFDVLPEALETASAESVFAWTIIGFLAFFILERSLRIYHCHEGHCPVHAVGYLNLIGDGIHNFIDGIIIALSFLVNPALGVRTAFAVILHEVPQEMSDFLVLLHAGFERKKALFYNFLVALPTIAGALLAYAFSGLLSTVIGSALGLVAGHFLYIAAVDLVPELHEGEHAQKKTASLVQAALIVLGIAIIWTGGELLGH